MSMKNSNDTIGNRTATLRLAAQCFNRLPQGTISSLLSYFNHFSSASSTSLPSGFRNRLIHDPPRSKALIILVMLLQIVWIVEFTRQNSRHFSYFVSILHFMYQFNVLFLTLKTFLLFVTVSVTLSPVD
jgi:hypothetical protein